MDDWLKLFNIAMAIIDDAQKTSGGNISWTIGGGTMLQQMFSHRLSHDLDIFVDSPQILLFLTPRTNGVAEFVVQNGSYVEAANHIKIITPDGEIDFIVAPRLTSPHSTKRVINNRQAMVETPQEILAKKLLYKASEFTARDVFDLAFLIQNGEAQKLIKNKNVYADKLGIALKRICAGKTELQISFDKLSPQKYNASFEECIKVIKDFYDTL